MKVVLFGATGMVGQGVLRELLLDERIAQVLAIGRTTSQTHPKLLNLVQADLFDLSSLQAQLVGVDACFFCLGVSSAGLSEQAYTRIIYELTIAVAQTLLSQSPQSAFLFISGAGTDSTERKGPMWARVKGKTENALLDMRFRAVFCFRPGFIRPLHGITSRTASYRLLYTMLTPFMPLIARLNSLATTTEKLAKAMIKVALDGYDKPVLETRDINQVAASA